METSREKKHPLLSLRPKFDMTIFILEALPVVFAGTAGLVMVVGTFIFILFSLIGLSKFIPASSIYTILFVLGIALIPPLFFEIKRRAFQRTFWNFYDNYIEFQFFRYYLVRERGRLHYADISNVIQRAGAIQERLHLTTILLLSPSSSYIARDRIPGLKIADIPDANSIGQRIQNIIDNMRNRPVAETAPPPLPAAAGVS